MKNKRTYFQERLRRYQRQRFDYLNRYLDKYAITRLFKTLHKLRVEIKKITALVHLIEYCRQMPVSPLKLKHLDKIFHLAGKVRSYKIDKKLANEFGAQSLQLHTGTYKAKTAKKKLRDKHKKYEKRMTELREECMTQLSIINPENLNSYLQNQINFVDSFQSKSTTATLHELRKRIKEIQYLYPLRDSSLSQKINKTQLIHLDQVQDAIGLWHDIDKFIHGIQAESRAGAKIKIPVSLIAERKKRLARTEKIINAGTGKKITVKTTKA